MKILALDLGKFKTVSCVYDTATNKATYQTRGRAGGGLGL
jgi:hypothetical protein